MILYGQNLKEEINGSQPCNTISQLLLHNGKKQTRVAKTSYRHSYQREPPVPLYVGLSLHTQTRSKKLVDSLEKLGLAYPMIEFFNSKIGWLKMFVNNSSWKVLSAQII